MNIRITFLGAAESVTSSKYYVEMDDCNILVDYGMFQEHNLKDRNWENFPDEASSIDAVLLTHAHLEHCGLLPKLVQEGFQGSIYCTGATIDIAKIVLLDAAKDSRVRGSIECQVLFFENFGKKVLSCLKSLNFF